MKKNISKSKSNTIYTKNKKYISPEFKTVLPNKFSAQKRSRLREFEKQIIEKSMIDK